MQTLSTGTKMDLFKILGKYGKKLRRPNGTYDIFVQQCLNSDGKIDKFKF